MKQRLASRRGRRGLRCAWGPEVGWVFLVATSTSGPGPLAVPSPLLVRSSKGTSPVFSGGRVTSSGCSPCLWHLLNS